MTDSAVLHNVRINTGACPSRGEVFIDGVLIKGVRNVSFDFGVDKMPVIHLEMIVSDVTIDAINAELTYSQLSVTDGNEP